MLIILSCNRLDFYKASLLTSLFKRRSTSSVIVVFTSCFSWLSNATSGRDIYSLFCTRLPRRLCAAAARSPATATTTATTVPTVYLFQPADVSTRLVLNLLVFRSPNAFAVLNDNEIQMVITVSKSIKDTFPI